MSGLQRRFLLLSLLLPLLLIGVMGIISFSELAPQRQRAEDQRIELIAKGLANRIGYAAQVGVPLEKLPGVDAEFEKTLKQHPELGRLVLTDAQGRALWPRQNNTDTTPADLTQAITAQGRTIGYLQISITKRTPVKWIEIGLIMLVIWATGACVLYETVRFEIRRGPLLRNAVIDRSNARVMQGDFTVIYGGAASAEHDARPRLMAAAIRSVHERMLRLRRLVGSLRQTEPSRSRRERLDHLLDEAQSKDRFALNKTNSRLLNAAFSEARFVLFLISTACSGLLLSGLHRFSAVQIGLTLAGFLACILIGRLAAARVVTRYSRALLAASGVGVCMLGFLLSLSAELAWIELTARLMLGIGLGIVLAATDTLAHDQAIATLTAPGEMARDTAWGLTAGMLFVAPVLVPILSSSVGSAVTSWMFAVPLIAALLTLIRLVSSSAPWGETAETVFEQEIQKQEGAMGSTQRVVLLMGGLMLGSLLTLTQQLLSRQLESFWVQYAFMGALAGAGWIAGTHWRLSRTPLWLSGTAICIGCIGIAAPDFELGLYPHKVGLSFALMGIGWGLVSTWMNGRTGRAAFGAEALVGALIAIACLTAGVVVWAVPAFIVVCLAYVFFRSRGKGVVYAA